MNGTRSVTLSALAGLAWSVSAQSATLYFGADQTRIHDAAPTLLAWTVSIGFTVFDDPSAYVGGFAGEFFGIGIMTGAGAHEIVGISNLMNGQALSPFVDGALVGDVNIFNAAVLGTDQAGNPLDIFEIRVMTAGIEPISFMGGGTVTIFPDDSILTPPARFDDFEVISDRVIFPAPGAAGVLACGAVWTARRRRS